MSETDGGLRKIFRSRLPEVHWTSIEARLVQGGIPDMHGTWRGRSFWIENKRARGLEISLRPSQIGWLLRNARNGGRAFIAVRKGKTLWLLSGQYANTIARGSLQSLPPNALLGCWHGGPANWPWKKIVLLFSR